MEVEPSSPSIDLPAGAPAVRSSPFTVRRGDKYAARVANKATESGSSVPNSYLATNDPSQQVSQRGSQQASLRGSRRPSNTGVPRSPAPESHRNSMQRVISGGELQVAQLPMPGRRTSPEPSALPAEHHYMRSGSGESQMSSHSHVCAQ